MIIGSVLVLLAFLLCIWRIAKTDGEIRKKWILLLVAGLFSYVFFIFSEFVFHATFSTVAVSLFLFGIITPVAAYFVLDNNQ